MAFDLALIKEHPYATGTIVIVGGIVVFYLLSGSSSASSASTSGNSQSGVLAADTQLAQIQAGTAQANAAQQAQVQAAQLQYQAQQDQTSASVDINNTQTAAQLATALYGTQASLQATALNDNAQTVQQANQALFQQNTVAMQDAVLTNQINSGVIENANNNATAVAGAQIQAQVANNTINSSLTLAQQQEQDAYNINSATSEAYNTQIPYIVQKAGQQQNSALDATDQTGIFQTILAHGNPSVASVGSSGSSGTAVANNSTAFNPNTALTSLSTAASSIAQGFFG
jgi:hypothetical protein